MKVDIDFSKPNFSDATSVNLTNIYGWFPISVEYVYMTMGFATYLCWRICGTTHVFKIDLQTVYKHHGKNIEEHFIKTLTVFREDYINWIVNKDSRADTYHKEFGPLITM